MEELKKKLIAALKKARDLAKAAEDENRELTAEDRTAIKAALEEASGIRAQMKTREEDAELTKQINELGEGVVGVTEKSGEGKTAAEAAGRGKTIGEQFVESPAFKTWMKSVAPSGQIPESAKGLHSPPVEFKTLLTGGGSGSAGEVVLPDQAPLVPLGRRPLALRDLVTQGTTTSDTIEYARILAETNAAAAVAEATATGGSSGTKPESAFTFERVTTPVRTIAHWIPATKRALSDAGQLRTLIDNFLRDGLNQIVEDEMAAGDGTGEHFTGLAHISGIQTQAFDTDLFQTTRIARRKVRTVGRAIPTAYAMHPVDWEIIELSQNNNGDYYYGGPAQLAQPRLWGLPVVEVEALTQGTGYVGDFRKLVLWDREAASVSVSDSHADFFIRNMIAILAEMRAAFGCLQPSALVSIDLTP